MLRRIARPALVVTAVLFGLGAVVAALTGGAPSEDVMAESSRGELETGGAQSDVAPAPSGAAQARAVSDGSGGDEEAVAGAGPVEAVGDVASAGPSALGGSPVPGVPSRVIQTAKINVAVEKDGFPKSMAKVLAAVGTDPAHGYVQSSDVAEDHATYVLKVSAVRLPGVLAQLRGLGEVRSEGQAGQDVTAEYVDLDSRLRHWRAQGAVFVELMGRAKTIGETIQVQQQLAVVQQQVEELEGRRRYLEGQTAFSTIELILAVDGAAVPEPAGEHRSTLARAWERSAGAALAVVGGTIVVLGVVVPLSLVLGLPTLAVFGLRRRARAAGVPVSG